MPALGLQYPYRTFELAELSFMQIKSQRQKIYFVRPL